MYLKNRRNHRKIFKSKTWTWRWPIDRFWPWRTRKCPWICIGWENRIFTWILRKYRTWIMTETYRFFCSSSPIRLFYGFLDGRVATTGQDPFLWTNQTSPQVCQFSNFGCDIGFIATGYCNLKFEKKNEIFGFFDIFVNVKEATKVSERPWNFFRVRKSLKTRSTLVLAPTWDFQSTV